MKFTIKLLFLLIVSTTFAQQEVAMSQSDSLSLIKTFDEVCHVIENKQIHKLGNYSIHGVLCSFYIKGFSYVGINQLVIKRFRKFKNSDLYTKIKNREYKLKKYSTNKYPISKRFDEKDPIYEIALNENSSLGNVNGIFVFHFVKFNDRFFIAGIFN